ncbi:hypothetical protein PALA9_02571 [Pseudomonas aeruginosa]|nr:hypothetical protein PALA9_02571 [Pseudomonas aeruginosa]
MIHTVKYWTRSTVGPLRHFILVNVVSDEEDSVFVFVGQCPLDYESPHHWSAIVFSKQVINGVALEETLLVRVFWVISEKTAWNTANAEGDVHARVCQTQPTVSAAQTLLNEQVSGPSENGCLPGIGVVIRRIHFTQSVEADVEQEFGNFCQALVSQVREKRRWVSAAHEGSWQKRIFVNQRIWQISTFVNQVSGVRTPLRRGIDSRSRKRRQPFLHDPVARVRWLRRSHRSRALLLDL